VIATIAQRSQDGRRRRRAAHRQQGQGPPPDPHPAGACCGTPRRLADRPRRALGAEGLPPEQAVEIQTLVGDPTDNVPGIRGVGVKTAAKLIERYGTADAVIAHADEQTPKLRENLLAGADGLAAHAPAGHAQARRRPRVRPRGLRHPQGHEGRRARAVRGAGVPRPARRIPDDPAAPAGPPAPPPAATTYRRVDDRRGPRGAGRRPRGRRPAFAIDTETTGLSVVDADLVGYASRGRRAPAGTCRSAATPAPRSIPPSCARRCGRSSRASTSARSATTSSST
jgi:hypothetical protein